MSSLKSVTDAIASVAERSFFAYAEPVTAAVPMPGECYEISVAFTGAFSGIVRIVMPLSLAFELCTAFAGVDPGEGMESSSVADLAGEFGNMSCGTWLTGLTGVADTVCFSLTHPVVQPCADAESRPAVMLINDQPISVTLELQS